MRVQITWTPGAQAALKALSTSGALDAAREKRRWNAALRLAARECVASVRPRGQAREWAAQHRNVAWSLDASFVCDEEMRELNARFRSKDRPTDVLSFSQAESATLDSNPPDLEELESDDAAEDSDSGAEIQWPSGFGALDGQAEAALGDLVIAVETAGRQARERAHKGDVEVLFLSIHGTLHLLGYDHQASSQRVAMWREQEALFDRLRARGQKKKRPK